jgi:hypothetical protein
VPSHVHVLGVTILETPTDNRTATTRSGQLIGALPGLSSLENPTIATVATAGGVSPPVGFQEGGEFAPTSSVPGVRRGVVVKG